jgi:hypothetical protein
MFDTDTSFTPVLKVDGGTANVVVNATTAKATPVTLTGLESGDIGTVTFRDTAGHTVPLAVSASQTNYTVNLSSLVDGTITSSLSVTDSTGNATPATGNPVTLDQDKLVEMLTLTAPSSLTVAAGRSANLGIVIGAVDSDDTLKVSISGVPRFESVSAAGATPMVTKHGSTYTYTFSALPTADWNNGLIINSSHTGKGYPTNLLTVTVSNTTTGESSTAPSKTISVTDPPLTASSEQPFTNGSLTPAPHSGGSIDLSAIGFSANTTLGYSANSDNSGGTLTVSDGPHARSLALLGQHMASSFVMGSDGHGGTLNTDPPPNQQHLLTAHPV